MPINNSRDKIDIDSSVSNILSGLIAIRYESLIKSNPPILASYPKVKDRMEVDKLGQ